ncbi:dynamin family protein [Parasedimentitalea psychrophila]|uniref:Dynamin family protein n=1 Tax=Parasedimentitalea psychrophila TaxID=2997337 RepID=A0A9Y2L0L3_9RHOB|nr:dynamin family protein [Parasedimentitalea psychrophila]WIY25854.1 dynamin family protein [Parasedimentitalea psychrophila]
MNMQPQIDRTTNIHAAARPANLNAGMEPLAELATQMAELDGALEALAGQTGDKAQRTLLRLNKELAGFEPCITLLGQVKSGKTSLVNAMGGWADLLPSDVNPWTSVVTSLHLTPGDARVETSARFQFMTEAEWDRLLTKGGRIGEMAGRAGAEGELAKIQAQIEQMRERSRNRLGRKFELLMGQTHEYEYFDKNLIERYICLGDDFDLESGMEGEDSQGRFADITRSADLYLNSPTVPIALCLRDTPGVNDTFMMREQVTIQAIRDSRICVVVLSASQALTSVDMGLIRMISTLKSREVVIFVNRIDELADPANQIPEIEASIRQTLDSHHGPKEAEIIFGSAYWAGKVLTGELEEMQGASGAALLNWAKVGLAAANPDQSPQDMAWALSGLPELLRSISNRIVKDLGAPLLARVASSAITMTTGQQAAHAVMIRGSKPGAALNMRDIETRFEQIVTSQMAALEDEIDAVFDAFRQRADRAHATFVNRATHSLIDHLERWGEACVWEYDATGLRLLLKSAYSVMTSRVQATALARYELAVQEVAGLLYAGFGTAVEGIQISVPEAPTVPSPVALGQTIALDFNDNWWSSWWRRTRGYKAFVKNFQQLICGETEDFMTQLKQVQTADTRASTLAGLQIFFEDQRNILMEIADHCRQDQDVQDLFASQGQQQRQDITQAALTTLGKYTA